MNKETCKKKKKKAKREHGRNKYKDIKKMQFKRVLKKWNITFLHSVGRSKKTLKFDNVELKN